MPPGSQPSTWKGPLIAMWSRFSPSSRLSCTILARRGGSSDRCHKYYFRRRSRIGCLFEHDRNGLNHLRIFPLAHAGHSFEDADGCIQVLVPGLLKLYLSLRLLHHSQYTEVPVFIVSCPFVILSLRVSLVVWYCLGQIDVLGVGFSFISIVASVLGDT